MHIAQDDRIAHPQPTVWRVLQDHLEALVPYMDTVEAIETVRREPLEDGGVRIVRRWQGSEAVVPQGLRALISREHLTWIDDAAWDGLKHRVTWHMETELGAELFRCKGVNSITPCPEASDSATRLRIDADLRVQPPRSSGLGGAVMKRLAPRLECWVGNLVGPNLSGLAIGVQRYMEATAARSTV